MDSSVETNKTPDSSKKVIVVAVVAVLVVIVVAAAVVLYFLNGKETDNQLGYASDAVVLLDEDSLQAAVDEAMANAKNSLVALEYEEHAYSTDGKNFSCYIANSASNLYDMFLTIFADAELSDQVFLSELIPPGSGFEQITLDHALEPGDHVVYVAVTQVDTDENGTQVLKNQVVHTMTFHVE